uniref:Uncharacterized protein n=1 Tax=Caenorhabditis japonica TaxID=281687 RepID=A0A8R1IJ57_CAEJA
MSHLLAAAKFIIDSKADKVARKLYSACPRKGQNRASCVKFDKQRSEYVIRELGNANYSVLKVGRGNVQWAEYEVVDYLNCMCDVQEDPPLPGDIDPQEYEFRITEWKRCALCLAPAHFSCTIATKTCQCSPGSFFELYSDNFQQEIDSDEN